MFSQVPEAWVRFHDMLTRMEHANNAAVLEEVLCVMLMHDASSPSRYALHPRVL